MIFIGIARIFFWNTKTFAILSFCSKLVDEKESLIYAKLNRRIESLARLKSNTTKEDSEESKEALKQISALKQTHMHCIL